MKLRQLQANVGAALSDYLSENGIVVGEDILRQATAIMIDTLKDTCDVVWEELVDVDAETGEPI